MIAKLTGTLDAVGEDWAVIDVAGVGYLVHCSSRTLAALGETGGPARVFTDLQVSENDMRLLGFAAADERDWFRLLTGVQGVGSKVALAILSALTTTELQAACAAGDAASVARAQGGGAKAGGADRQRVEGSRPAGWWQVGRGNGRYAIPRKWGGGGRGLGAREPGLQTTGGRPRGRGGPAVSWAREAELDALVRVALKHASR